VGEADDKQEGCGVWARGVAINWAADVAEHDYAAAQAYLSLKLTAAPANKAVTRLRRVKLTSHRANDILRAAGLSAAPLDDPGVVREMIKVIEGKALSPILMVNGADGADIADGFHRASLVYRLDPRGVIPIKLANVGRQRDRS
jgi:hypothetical protein